MNATIVVFPGSNRERDAGRALALVTGRDPTYVWHGETSLPSSDLIVIPGGFSYGDYLRCGAMAAHSPIMRDVVTKANSGTPVLGICNGFQILTEAGLLPGALMRNTTLRFICKPVMLKVERIDTVFTSAYRQGQIVRFPIAHAEGNYFADTTTLARLEDEGLVVFRYCDEAGQANVSANPNGAQHNIAGICSPSRRVLGLMPHPENMVEPLHGGTDGLALFQSLLAARHH